MDTKVDWEVLVDVELDVEGPADMIVGREGRESW